MTTSSRTALCAAAALAVLATGPAQAREFNASIWFPDAHPLTRHGYIEWAPVVEERSEGRLKPRLFIGDVLLPPAGHLSGLRDGIAQLAYHAGTYTPAELPQDNVLAQLAFNYTDYFVAAFAITDMNMRDPEMQEQWKGQNIVYAGGYATPPYILMCSSRITNLQEIRGKRLRMPGAAHSDWARSVGAVPVNVPSTEMYTGLERGQLDCASNAANDMKSRSLWDVAKHTTLAELGVYWAGYQHAFNRDFWRSLEPQDRRVLLDTIAEAMVTTGLGYMAAAREALDEAGEHGVTVHEPAEELAQSIEDFRAKARDAALELGKERFSLPDPEGLVSRFEAVAARWEKALEGVDREDAEALTAILKRELYDQIDERTYGTD
jgi:TRAP-type transport system periplasmic protein